VLTFEMLSAIAPMALDSDDRLDTPENNAPYKLM